MRWVFWLLFFGLFVFWYLSFTACLFAHFIKLLISKQLNIHRKLPKQYRELLCTLLPVFPNGNILQDCSTIAKPGNCIGTVHKPYSDLTSFTCFCMCVFCVCIVLCNFIIYIDLGTTTILKIQNCSTPIKSSLILPLYSHSQSSPLLLIPGNH